MDIFIFIASMGLLIYGADFIVNQSEKIALHFNIAPFIIGDGFGLTVTVILSESIHPLASVPTTVYVTEPIAGVNDAPSTTPLSQT